jgi:glutamate/aspartate transport system permease protein
MSGFDFDVIERSASYLFLVGMRFTLTLTLLSAAGGLLLGTLIALLRSSGNRALALIATSYVNLVRSLPLVLVIFWFFFLVPYLAQWATGARRPVQVGAFPSALITFTVFEAAYFSEIVRAGINSIARGQNAAGLAIGLRPGQVMRYVILPQVFRTMAPVMLSQTIILFQDTSLVYVLGLVDFLGAASQVAQRDGRLVEMYLFVAAVYLAISFTASRGVARLQAAVAVPR